MMRQERFLNAEEAIRFALWIIEQGNEVYRRGVFYEDIAESLYDEFVNCEVDRINYNQEEN